jgi:hypothetical protein
MKNSIEKIVTILAGLVVTGGLAWGLYLQGRIDAVSAQSAVHATELEVDKAHFEYIKESLARIESRLDIKEKKNER